MSNRNEAITRVVFGLLLLVIFSVGFMKPSIGLRFGSLQLTDLIFPAAFLCWLVAIAAGASEFRWRAEYWVFAFYLAALFVSAIFSVNARLSFIKLAGTFYLVLLAIITANLVTSVELLKLSLLAWLAGSGVSVLAAVIGIAAFYIAPESDWLPVLTHHHGAVPFGNFPRISSTFVSASMFCNYLTVTLLIALVSERMGWISSLVFFALAVTIGVSSVFTVSIALGGFILAIGFWVWLDGPATNIRRAAMIGACIMAAGFVAVAPLALFGTDDYSSSGLFTPSSRFLVWRDAISVFLSDPISGKGVGTAVAEVVFQNSDGSRSLLTDAHNMFLNVAAQAGLPGLVAIVALVVVVGRTAWSGQDRIRRNNVRTALAIAFVTAFVYDGLTGSFEDARHLWILIGLILAASRIDYGPDESIPLNGA